jgi:hypothetical protein
MASTIVISTGIAEIMMHTVAYMLLVLMLFAMMARTRLTKNPKPPAKMRDVKESVRAALPPNPDRTHITIKNGVAITLNTNTTVDIMQRVLDAVLFLSFIGLLVH